MDKKRGWGLSPAPRCAVFRHLTELLLLDLEAKGHRSSNLVLDFQSIRSCTDLATNFKYERANAGHWVHRPLFDLAFLLSQVYLPLLSAEPHTVYSDLVPQEPEAVLIGSISGL